MKKSSQTLVFCTCLLALLGLVATSAGADVKMVTQTQYSGPGDGGGESTLYIKGMKMRQDSPEQGTSMILDLESGQMILLETKKERAQVFDMNQVQEQMEQFTGSGVDVSLEPTGATQTVAGTTCNVHDMRVVIEVEMAPGSGMGATLVMDGSACLVPDAPGADDYERFYVAMAEKGFFFGDPRAAQGPGAGQQKGMAQLYRQIAEKGVAYHTDLESTFEGSGMIAKMMEKMSFDTETTVTSVSTDALPDSLFEVPAGWKVKQAN